MSSFPLPLASTLFCIDIPHIEFKRIGLTQEYIKCGFCQYTRWDCEDYLLKIDVENFREEICFSLLCAQIGRDNVGVLQQILALSLQYDAPCLHDIPPGGNF